ncbi:MAG: outer membrane lipoprotein carrier protein LolA [Bacteroidales bacterium]|nr:outer membrane lipoprotein carrier protein LolA [Bacteroidales bacterium]
MKPLVIIALLIGSTLSALSQDKVVLDKAKSDNILDKIAEKSKGIKTFESNIEQSKYLTFLGATVNMKGKIWFKQEKKIRWDYTEPNRYSIKVNNGKIAIDNKLIEENYKGNESNLIYIMNNFLTGLISGDALLNKDYVISVLQSTTGYHVKFVPNNTDLLKIMKEMELTFSANDYILQSISQVEASGDVITIRLVNMKQNHNISDSVFEI